MKSRKQSVALLGATSLVGECLLPLLMQAGCRVVAFSRQPKASGDEGVEWRVIPSSRPAPPLRWESGVQCWISIAPIWVLSNYFRLLETHDAKRVVALSSTSRFIKGDSSDSAEQAIAQRLIEGETRLRVWAEKNDIEWVILRPTLIYGHGQDKNIAEIARFARRFGFFPLLGKANGLRQPIHVEDVAGACFAALNSPEAKCRAYNVSGGETLPYHEMVRRVFVVLHRQPRMVKIPLAAFRFLLTCSRVFPRYRHWSVAMAERMNRDLIFDHSDAVRDLGFSPRPFRLAPKDMPP